MQASEPQKSGESIALLHTLSSAGKEPPVEGSPKEAAILLRLCNLRKAFGALAAVDDVSLGIHRGEFFALLGPSGCGKTTLMRMIAGLESPDAGQILLDDIDIAAFPPHRRPINMMFQSYALFPHMSVEKNIAFGLYREGLGRSAIADRVSDILRLVQLQGLGARKPDQLSGGQRQRVALARALVKRPRLLLLDEPLAALDRKLREETRFELATLHRRLGLTFIMVTHDQEEAMMMADRIAVMGAGRVMQVGTPADIYERPNSRHVARFVGDINLFESFVEARNGAFLRVSCAEAGRSLTVVAPDPAPAHGLPVTVAIRPERVMLAHEGGPVLTNPIEGIVEGRAYFGSTTLLSVRLASGKALRVGMNSSTQGYLPDVGAAVTLGFAPEAALVLP